MLQQLFQGLPRCPELAFVGEQEGPPPWRTLRCRDAPGGSHELVQTPLCPKCRHEARKDSWICPNCGTYVEQPGALDLRGWERPEWDSGRALASLALYVLVAVLLSLPFGPVRDEASFYLFSAAAQALAAVFGLVWAVLALSSQVVATVYEVSPVSVLAHDEQTGILTWAYVMAIVLCLLQIPLSDGTRSSWDDFAVIAVVAWVLSQTVGFIDRALTLFRPSRMVRELLLKISPKALAEAEEFEPATGSWGLPFLKSDPFGPIVRILTRLAERSEAYELAASFDALAMSLHIRFPELPPEARTRAIRWVWHRLADVPKGTGDTERASHSGLASVVWLLVIRFRNEAAELQVLFDWCLAVFLAARRENLVQICAFSPALSLVACGALLYRLQPDRASALLREAYKRQRVLEAYTLISQRDQEGALLAAYHKAIEALADGGK